MRTKCLTAPPLIGQQSQSMLERYQVGSWCGALVYARCLSCGGCNSDVETERLFLTCFPDTLRNAHQMPGKAGCHSGSGPTVSERTPAAPNFPFTNGLDALGREAGRNSPGELGSRSYRNAPMILPRSSESGLRWRAVRNHSRASTVNPCRCKLKPRLNAADASVVSASAAIL